jgi:hypothetical protein
LPDFPKIVVRKAIRLGWLPRRLPPVSEPSPSAKPTLKLEPLARQWRRERRAEAAEDG